jgi:ammonium transporter, Amt family
VGALSIGIFASQTINPAGPVGWLYSGSPMQLIIQGVGVGVAALMAFVGTFIILKIIDYVIGLRVNENEEDLGLDVTQHAEAAYGDR